MTSEQELEAIYGLMASHSEHERGEHITYTSAEGLPCEGTIIWCCAPGVVGNEYMGLRYLVETDELGGFGLDVVWPADIISSDTQEDQEPTLSPCPYCFGQHPSHLVDECPLNPKNARES